MKYEKLIKRIEDIAPLELAEEWDNSGVQIYTGKKEISSVMVCLEITDEVISEAEDMQADMIISHHPLFFKPVSSVDICSVQGRQTAGRYAVRLIKDDICVYSAHLTFDNADGGNNDHLAELLGITDAVKLNGKDVTAGIIGTLPETTTLGGLCAELKSTLSLDDREVTGAGDKKTMISRIVICTGSGGDLVQAAAEAGGDVLVTGDVSYHEAQLATALGLCVIDAGHWGTEKIFTKNFASRLRERCGKEPEIAESLVDINPFMV